MIADFNGTVPLSISAAEREALWQEIESRSQEDLEHEVYERQNYILCPECRRKWAADPLGRGLGPHRGGQAH